jgi:hypothetical protein
MKKDLLKQLQSYSALVAGLITVEAAHGQIVYTDVDPDEDVHGDYDALNYKDDGAVVTYQIDLDDDGNADYTLRVRSDQAHGAGFLDPEEGNYYVINPESTSPFASPLDSLDQIGDDNDQTWETLLVYPNGYNYLGTVTTLGKTAAEGGGGWTGKTDKYLGLKFQIGSNYHYGWVRMDTRDDSRLYTVKDFAYNTVPDSSIKAGQTVAETGGETAIISAKVSDTKVYVSGNQLNIVLSGEEGLNSDVKLYNLSGSLVLEGKLENLENVFSLDAQAGLYLLKIDFEDGIYTKKIILR